MLINLPYLPPSKNARVKKKKLKLHYTQKQKESLEENEKDLAPTYGNQKHGYCVLPSTI